jgi:biopolymer transport protein TolR
MGTITAAARRGPRRLMADINVTPMVDVMLVLLVVFMITAPMLATGVSVNLPRTQAAPLASAKNDPLVVTVTKDGRIFVGQEKTPAELASLPAQLEAIANGMVDKRVYVGGDGDATYQQVVSVLALLQTAGFANVALLVDPRTMGPARLADPEVSRR